MKTRPILFSGDMVRALLDGRKTQTRRIVKPQPDFNERVGFSWKGYAYGIGANYPETVRNFAKPVCPHGVPGDLLWVRETTESHEHETFHAALSCYSADGSPVLYSNCDDPEYNGSWAHWDYPRDSRPSIHMHRWASRLTLRITNVRVERLQDISEVDAKAEGPAPAFSYPGLDGVSATPWYRWGFHKLWEQINGPESWTANPWVWVIEFEVIHANVDAVLKREAA